MSYVDRETLFRSSDFISIHLKLSARVRHLVGAEELAMMKPDAYLVNTSRAPIFDIEALIHALAIGGGARTPADTVLPKVFDGSGHALVAELVEALLEALLKSKEACNR